MSSTEETRSSGVAEIASIGERMGYLQGLRAAIALIVLAAGLIASNIVGAGIEDLMFITAGFLLLSAAVEGLRRAGRGRGLTAVGLMLLVDGVYLAWVMYQTGGTQSPLRFLVYLHLIAVTLLASYRTGLKIALWHSILFFVVFYAQASEIIKPLEPGTEVGSNFQRPSFFNVVAFWLVALTTTAFSAVNERELKRRKSDLEALSIMTERLENVDSASAVAEILLEGVAETFGFHRGVVLASQDGKEPSMLAFKGPNDAPEANAHLDSVVERAWSKHQPLLLKKLDPEADPQLSALLPFAKSLVVVPLFAEGQPLGVLAVEHAAKKPGRIERRIVDMMSQFASHGALALRNAWLLEQVRRMAATDGLTGIANRRSFEETLERELSRAQRNGEPVTLVMLDVDHFKQLNDTHGHQTGDQVLKLVAASLKVNCRDFDTPARYGGEEFVVVLPACSAKESLIAGERLRRGISEAPMPVPVTASAGIATFPAHGANPESLIKAADEALYESKRSGRDRLTRSRRRAPRSESTIQLER